MRLIDADAACEKCGAKEVGACSDECVLFMDSLPTIKVEPVVHGRWVTGNELNTRRKFLVTHFLYCSVCREEAYWDTDYGQQRFNYCPNCGAKMQGGADNG